MATSALEKKKTDSFLIDLAHSIRKVGTQADMATEIGVGPPELAGFLSGKKSLPIYAAANLAEKLGLDPRALILRIEARSAGRGLAALALDKSGLAAERARLSRPDRSNKDRSETIARANAIAAIEAKLTKLLAKENGLQLIKETFQDFDANGSGISPVAKAKPGLLTNWREWLAPVTVFVGDRREPKPQSAADVLAASASCGDLFYLAGLQLPADTPILSDKTLVIAEKEKFEEMVKGRNLLIIGSPAANLVSRDVNKGACFAFHTSDEAFDYEREIRPELEALLGKKRKLAEFVVRAREADKKKSKSIQKMIYDFARGGVFDPLYESGLRATSVGGSNDFGVVTLCRHPWSKDNVAIMAAGLHGPGTAAALKLLRTGDFSQHPLGGVFEIDVPTILRWEIRYPQLEFEWDGDSNYSLKEYRNRIATLCRKKGEVPRYWEPLLVQELLDMIARNL